MNAYTFAYKYSLSSLSERNFPATVAVCCRTHFKDFHSRLFEVLKTSPSLFYILFFPKNIHTNFQIFWGSTLRPRPLFSTNVFLPIFSQFSSIRHRFKASFLTSNNLPLINKVHRSRSISTNFRPCPKMIFCLKCFVFCYFLLFSACTKKCGEKRSYESVSRCVFVRRVMSCCLVGSMKPNNKPKNFAAWDEEKSALIESFCRLAWCMRNHSSFCLCFSLDDFIGYIKEFWSQLEVFKGQKVNKITSPRLYFFVSFVIVFSINDRWISATGKNTRLPLEITEKNNETICLRSKFLFFLRFFFYSRYVKKKHCCYFSILLGWSHFHLRK